MRSIVRLALVTVFAVGAIACVDVDKLHQHMVVDCFTTFAQPGVCSEDGHPEHDRFAFTVQAERHVSLAQQDCIMKVKCDSQEEKRNAFQAFNDCLGQSSERTPCERGCDDGIAACGGACSDGEIVQCLDDYDACDAACAP